MCAKFGSDRTTDATCIMLGRIHTQTHTHTLLYRYKITPDRFLHFDQATIIRPSTSFPHPPLPSITQPMYLKLFTDGSGSPSNFTTQPVDEMVPGTLFSITALHLSSSSSTSSTVSPTSTNSSANSIAHGGLVLASSANTSLIILCVHCIVFYSSETEA